MSSSPAALAAALILAMFTATPVAAACPEPATALGVARVVEIDAAGGPIFGAMTSQAREARFLGPKEVVLTFDDGPMPGITRSILDTLDRFCTKATFFSVGRMAIAHPALVREVLGRGHTLGTHTWSHPMNLPRLSPERARDQIDSGFAAVALAAGAPIAPFFRFPGLSDSPALLDHLQRRGIAAFTVDVVSNDSYIADPGAPRRTHTRACAGGERWHSPISRHQACHGASPADYLARAESPRLFCGAYARQDPLRARRTKCHSHPRARATHDAWSRSCTSGRNCRLIGVDESCTHPAWRCGKHTNSICWRAARDIACTRATGSAGESASDRERCGFRPDAAPTCRGGVAASHDERCGYASASR